jgi:hypothetical protein
MKLPPEAFHRLPPIRPAGVVAWLMVGLALYLLSPAWRSDVRGAPPGLDEALVLLVALLAWCASAMAGDQPFHRWMSGVKWAGVLLFGMVGAQALLFGSSPDGGLRAVLGLVCLWTAWVFTLPPRPPRGEADRAGPPEGPAFTDEETP